MFCFDSTSYFIYLKFPKSSSLEIIANKEKLLTSATIDHT